MSITLNTVGIEIDGRVYEMRKMTLGFQRKMMHLQKEVSDEQKKLEKKYDGDLSKATQEENFALAEKNLGIQDVVAGLFVNPDDAEVLDNFDHEALGKLIEALQ